MGEEGSKGGVMMVAPITERDGWLWEPIWKGQRLGAEVGEVLVDVGSRDWRGHSTALREQWSAYQEQYIRADTPRGMMGGKVMEASGLISRYRPKAGDWVLVRGHESGSIMTGMPL
jgi:hypothetical protein